MREVTTPTMAPWMFTLCKREENFFTSPITYLQVIPGQLQWLVLWDVKLDAISQKTKFSMQCRCFSVQNSKRKSSKKKKYYCINWNSCPRGGGFIFTLSVQGKLEAIFCSHQQRLESQTAGRNRSIIMIYFFLIKITGMEWFGLGETLKVIPFHLLHQTRLLQPCPRHPWTLPGMGQDVCDKISIFFLISCVLLSARTI